MWKRKEDDAEAMTKFCEETLRRRRRHAIDENILGLCNPVSMGSQPLRTRWHKKDEEVLLQHFPFKPPKKVIRNVCDEHEELQEIVARNGFERVYEKVKTIYKRTRDLIG